MKRKFIELDGGRLSYLDNEVVSSYILFFIHGNSGSSRNWYKQYQDDLFAGYRLIVFDLPAHGESDAWPNPQDDYSLIALGQTMANAVLAIAPTAGSYLLVGLSLGTNVVAEMLANKKILPKGVVLVSSCVVGGVYTIDKIFKTDIDMSIFFTDKPDRNLVDSIFKRIVTNRTDVQNSIADFYKTNEVFRSELAKSIAQDKLSDEMALISTYTGSMLIVFGKDESAVNPDYLDGAAIPLWRSQIYKLEGNHIVNIDSSEEFNKLLIDYCKDMFLQ
ncbi:MAG: alpha/beta hydrolase fold protein [Bacteroidetes bacterium OLB12]|nr:MAG: alpha/beta hydrolase fold protein [Bacteroidetes bacterium OLB12]